MTNNKKIRLIQVAKEFKVGVNSIADFLLKKGMLFVATIISVTVNLLIVKKI